jgi:uncharacterized protein (TIGR00255 family)
MTGHGQGTCESNGLSVWTEIRSVNNRFLKVTLACRERHLAFQSEIESVVRRHVQRGSVHIQIRITGGGEAPAIQIDADLVRSLREQLLPLLSAGESVPVAALLAIPGVVTEPTIDEAAAASEWSAIASATEAALRDLNQMRRREGAALACDIQQNCESIRELARQVAARAPKVIEGYSTRLTHRINQLLAPLGDSIAPADVVREVGMFAERSDISEELVRLDSHCRQFLDAIAQNGGASCGRRLDFLTQELLREANTIGSKAGDAEIARCVVDIKTAIERIREMVQNIE